jgi:two-component system sensor histidine kinase UhpB
MIVLGAAVGTTLTKMLVDLSAFTLATMFTVAGVALSLILNYIVLRMALQPLSTLTSAVGHIYDGDVILEIPPVDHPDLAPLTQALNTMLHRLTVHTATIEANRQKLRTLSSQVISAQEDERNRIARELHDETCQSLISLLIALDRINAVTPRELTDLKTRISSARQLTSETLDGLRLLVADLRPSLLHDLGLIPAIRSYASERLEPLGVDVEFDLPSQLPRLPTRLETILFRISQEAISNIIKHAEASHVSITLTYDHDLSLLIEDDGVGFEVNENAPSSAEHMGLFGVRERAAAVGGQAEIGSSPGRGTILRVTIPLEDEP